MRYLPFLLVMPLILALFFVPDRGMRRLASASSITGSIDSAAVTRDGAVQVNGWACQPGSASEVVVAIYVGDLELAQGAANAPNEPAVAEACRDDKGQHRFQITVPKALASANSGKPIWGRVVSAEPSSKLAISKPDGLKLP